MRYFKIPLCRIFKEKSETIQEQTVYESKTLDKKLGYDIWAMGTVNLKLGVLRLFEWSMDLDMHNQRNTHA